MPWWSQSQSPSLQTTAGSPSRWALPFSSSAEFVDIGNSSYKFVKNITHETSKVKVCDGIGKVLMNPATMHSGTCHHTGKKQPCSQLQANRNYLFALQIHSNVSRIACSTIQKCIRQLLNSQDKVISRLINSKHNIQHVHVWFHKIFHVAAIRISLASYELCSDYLTKESSCLPLRSCLRWIQKAHDLVNTHAKNGWSFSIVTLDMKRYTGSLAGTRYLAYFPVFLTDRSSSYLF